MEQIVAAGDRARAGDPAGGEASPAAILVASSPEPAVVGETWGPEVVPAAIERVVGVCHPAEAGDPEMSKAEAIETALRELITVERLEAVAVRCFDLIGELGTTACPALSPLNDEDVVAGCEGDLVGAVGLWWVRHLLGEVPWMANPTRLDTSAGTVTLVHCTVPRGLVAGHRFDTHFESDRGIGIAGEFRPGPVTLLRIDGPGWRICSRPHWGITWWWLRGIQRPGSAPGGRDWWGWSNRVGRVRSREVARHETEVRRRTSGSRGDQQPREAEARSLLSVF
jgi:hypothetical protein